MSNHPQPDFQAIRDKLHRQIAPPGPSDTEPSLIDWASPQPSQAPAKTHLSQLNGTVAALQQRSATYAPEDSPTVPPPASPPPHTHLLRLLQLHRGRLKRKADEINALSIQQERAMIEMKEIGERWSREIQSYMASAPDTTRIALAPLTREFLCHYEAALLAWTETDANGNVVLAYRSADFDQATRDAHEVARTLRSHRGQIPQRSTPWQEWQMLWAEPLAGLQAGWRWLRSWLQQGIATTGATTQRRSPPTIIDAVIWLGGGILSRIALDFVLSLYPGLWSIAVAVITAMTAYALYRATLAPKLDFSLAYRVLLAVGGLLLGGRL